MSKKPEDTEGEPVKLDFSGLKEALVENQKAMFAELKEALRPTEKGGKGFVGGGGKQEKLVESLKKVREENWKLAEQWTVAVSYTHLTLPTICSV